MFDLGKLAEMSKLASEAKQLQERQDRYQKESLKLLEKISRQLDELIALAKEKK